MAATDSSNVTWVIDKECPRPDAPEIPCEVRQVTHYGMPTPHLMCLPHGEIVGYIEEGE